MGWVVNAMPQVAYLEESLFLKPLKYHMLLILYNKQLFYLATHMQQKHTKFMYGDEFYKLSADPH
jgi:hypothetical protein